MGTDSGVGLRPARSFISKALCESASLRPHSGRSYPVAKSSRSFSLTGVNCPMAEQVCPQPDKLIFGLI